MIEHHKYNGYAWTRTLASKNTPEQIEALNAEKALGDSASNVVFMRDALRRERARRSKAHLKFHMRRSIMRTVSAMPFVKARNKRKK